MDKKTINTEDKFLKKIIGLAKTNPDIRVLWLYGSRANNTAHAKSDYDLAIAFKNFIKDPLTRRLRPEHLAIEWAQALQCDEHKLSIVDINLIPATLAWEIITHGKALLTIDQDRLIKEESRINSQYEIDVTYHRKHYG